MKHKTNLPQLNMKCTMEITCARQLKWGHTTSTTIRKNQTSVKKRQKSPGGGKRSNKGSRKRNKCKCKVAAVAAKRRL